MRAWIEEVISCHSSKTGQIQFIFCSDAFLLDLNLRHLNHDYLTDIITFDYTEGGTLSGELYISVDRVHDNASSSGIAFYDELHRVMIHGILHMCGFRDKTSAEQKQMRNAENQALTMRNQKLLSHL